MRSGNGFSQKMWTVSTSAGKMSRKAACSPWAPESPGSWVSSPPALLCWWFQAFFWNSATAFLFLQSLPPLFLSLERSRVLLSRVHSGMVST